MVGSSMIGLRMGEEIRHNVPVSSKFGKGRFIITNFGVSLTSNDQGSVMSILFPQLVEVSPNSTGFVLGVREKDGSTTYLDLLCKDTSVLSHLDMVTGDKKITSDAVPDIPLPDYTMCEERSPQVPQEVSSEHVWNDCYYDKPRGLYVTFNPFFMKIPELQTRKHQTEFKNQTGIGGIVATSDKVEMKHGYPAVLMDVGKKKKKWGKPKSGEKKWVLLPTMKKSMITSELLLAKHSESDIFFEEAS